MKLKRSIGLMIVVAASLYGNAEAADQTRTYQLKNRIRVEYDDNINETEDNTQDSLKVIEELELLVNLTLEQSFVGFRYRPSFVWWADREEDDTDLHHDLSLVLAHNFTPRLSGSIKETYRRAELPELTDRGVIVRQNNDFDYNLLDGSVSYLLRPATRLELAARHTLLRYDEESVAINEDYDIYAGGATLRHQVSEDTAVLGEYRRESIEYDGADRGSDSDYIGAGAEQIFSPNLLGNLRAGFQRKEYEDDAIDSSDAPYVDASLTYLPSPATRVTAGLGYSLFEADVFPFANQERTLLFASVAHDVTARVSLYLSASHQISQYDAEESIDQTVADGDENISQASARVSYKVNRNNWLEAGWQFLTLGSDLREEFERNRVELGWRTQL